MVKKFLVFQARTHRFWRRRRFFFFFFSMMYSGKSGTRSRKKKAVLALFRASPSQARSRTINQFLSCTLFLGHCVDVLAEVVRLRALTFLTAQVDSELERLVSLLELELLEDDGDGFDVGVPAEILFLSAN